MSGAASRGSSGSGRRGGTGTSSNTIIPLKKRWIALLNATLETWVHNLLYARHVYPRSESFAPHRFLGVHCYANRHPGVISYIQDAIQVAVPSLVDGMANEISLIIIEHRHQESSSEADGDNEINDEHSKGRGGENKTIEIEKFTLRLLQIVSDWNTLDGNSIEAADKIMNHLERVMRDLILSVFSSLETDSRRASSSTSDNVSFKISLHVNKQDTSSCSELNQAIADGTWWDPTNQGSTNNRDGDNESNRSHHLLDDQCGIRPLRSSKTPLCNIDFVMRKRGRVISNRNSNRKRRTSSPSAAAASTTATTTTTINDREDNNQHRKPPPPPPPPVQYDHVTTI